MKCSDLPKNVEVMTVVHIYGKVYIWNPSNVITPKLLKNADNRSVKTAENVLTVGGVFALNLLSPPQKNYNTLPVMQSNLWRAVSALLFSARFFLLLMEGSNHSSNMQTIHFL